MVNKVEVNLTVNGRKRTGSVEPRMLLIDFLRHELGMTGTHIGCEHGVCGACTIEMDGNITASCITLAVKADGANITTIEGVADGEKLHPIQEAFINHGGFQCGACTPGQIMAAKALLEHNPHPSEPEIKEWMMGNLCRCTGYYQIIESIQAAAEAN